MCVCVLGRVGRGGLEWSDVFACVYHGKCVCVSVCVCVCVGGGGGGEHVGVCV